MSLPFQIRRSDLAKLDVLEAKFNIYEELSREMMDKLEVAVDKISEANNRIATILTKHDERIEQTMKNDDNISKRLEIMKIENKEETADIVQRIEKVENKVEEFAKYRWIIIGVFAVISFTISQSNLVVDILTPDSSQTQIEKNK
ncbi:MAG: hypothetical protein ACO25L_04315 [Candidatus Nanopelagicales bacterium]|jgi:hypothetical protein